MEAANSYFVTHNAPGDCGWTRGTFYDGQSALYEVSKNASVLAYLTGWAVTHNYSCSDGKPANDFDANNQCAGHAYARLYEAAPADYKLAMSVTLSRQILNVTVPTLWNWVDALFMALPTWRVDTILLYRVGYLGLVCEAYHVWELLMGLLLPRLDTLVLLCCTPA